MSENTNKNKIDIQKLLKDKDAIMKLGFILVVLGFVLGYSASYVATVSEPSGLAVMQSGQALILFGVLLFMYYFLVFFDMKKKDEILCPHCSEEIEKDQKFCPHCGQDPNNDVEEKKEKKAKTSKKTD